MRDIKQTRHFHPIRHYSNAQVYAHQVLEALTLSQQPIVFQTPCPRHDAQQSQLAAFLELLQEIHHISVRVFRWGMRRLGLVDRVRRKSQKRRNPEKELYMWGWILPNSNSQNLSYSQKKKESRPFWIHTGPFHSYNSRASGHFWVTKRVPPVASIRWTLPHRRKLLCHICHYTIKSIINVLCFFR